MDDWLYNINSGNTACFILGKYSVNPLVCVGINPSTAEPDKLDNTVRQVASRAAALGYDSWITINVYPLRATNPDDMHKRLNRELHEKNLEVIKTHLNGSFDIWAAWNPLFLLASDQMLLTV